MAYGTAKSGTRSNSSPGVLKSLINALTTGSTASTHKAYTLDRVYSNFATQVVTGTTKADKFILEASLDGTNYKSVAGSTFTVSASLPSGSIIWITSKPAGYIRTSWITKATTSVVNAYIAPGL